MNKLKYMILLIVLLALIGCRSEAVNNQNDKEQFEQTQDNILSETDKEFLEEEVSNSIEIVSNSISFNDDDILIHYPSISGLDDSAHEQKVNDIILDEILFYIQPVDEIPKGQYYKLDYEVMFMDDRLLSIVYTGSEFSESSAYPVDVFFSTNIHLLNAEKLKLKDFITDDEELVKAYQSILNEGSDDELRKLAYDYILQTFDKDGLLKGFKEADETYGLGRYIFSYVTEDSLGISWEVPHVIGDHVETEISFELLKDILFVK